MDRPIDPDLYRQIMDMIFGAIRSKAVYAAAKLGLADELADGPLAIDGLARKTQTNPDALYRLMRALAGEGLFEEVEPGVFAVTDLGRLIGEDAPGSRRYLSLMFSEQTDPLFDHIIESLRTGRPAATSVYGTSYWKWLADHPEAAEIFNKAMASGAAVRLPVLLDLPLWKTAKSLVDVGGGNGTAVTALLERYPELQGTVFDLPHVQEEAELTLASAGLADRATFVGGSFFESVPGGADVYVLHQILHDWNDTEATKILRTIRRAATDDSTVVLLDQVVPEGGGPHPSLLLDLQMLLLLGGRERTEGEWRQLLAAGGFELQHVTTGARGSALEARPSSRLSP